MDNNAIPAYTKCKYTDQCDFTCNHHGEQHPVEFQCSIYEAFSMMEKKSCDGICFDCDKCVGVV